MIFPGTLNLIQGYKYSVYNGGMQYIAAQYIQASKITENVRIVMLCTFVYAIPS